MSQTCECADPGCSAHEGVPNCAKVAIEPRLFRIDQEDEGGTWFCQECHNDAWVSGLFRD